MLSAQHNTHHQQHTQPASLNSWNLRSISTCSAEITVRSIHKQVNHVDHLPCKSRTEENKAYALNFQVSSFTFLIPIMPCGTAQFAQCTFMASVNFFLIRLLREYQQKLFGLLLEATSYCEHIHILKYSIQTLLTKHSKMYQARGNVLRLNSNRQFAHNQNTGHDRYFLTNKSKNPSAMRSHSSAVRDTS